VDVKPRVLARDFVSFGAQIEGDDPRDADVAGRFGGAQGRGNGQRRRGRRAGEEELSTIRSFGAHDQRRPFTGV
jgi:hypothetical protein